MTIVGVISDTHSLLRPEAVEALKGSDLIVHAGDIGSPGIIDALSEIAPVFAVRGNVDKGEWASKFPQDEVVEVAGKYLYVLHNVNEIDLDPAAAGFEVVVSGHSHKPGIERRGGVLFVNPGSAGPRRFTLPVAIAKLHVSSQGIDVCIHELTLL
ncbi:metallophosphoesterase family protein [Candidatus Entotheonella palauensis]|uniref:metallophosphoesterase family protein n=1 Tax=Candidatus Entotheonella palauensis TaxID=93172 RepID=UPI000B7F7E19|nr:metallophosphoesterase family protein [Candidatus Entotheonella palauensis]